MLGIYALFLSLRDDNSKTMKTILICHENELINRWAIAAWLHSFSNLVAIVSIVDKKQHFLKRAQREIKRVGIFRFLDVIAFRLFHKLFNAKHDKHKTQSILDDCKAKYPVLDWKTIPILQVENPNAPEVEKLFAELQADIILARCKFILKESIFSKAKLGTFVLHPGQCPEYRNAHGCFWAIVNKDYAAVQATLLKIDKGIDTGPVFAYYSYDYNPQKESYAVIQEKVVTENLNQIRKDLQAIYNGAMQPQQRPPRFSKVWGQPWLSKYLRWRLNPQLELRK